MQFFLCDLFSFWRVIEKQFWHYFVLPSLVLWTFVWVPPTQKCDGPVLQHRKSDQRKPSSWAPRQSQGHNINNLEEEYKLVNCCQGRKQALTLQIPQKFIRTCFFVLISTVLLYDHVFGCAARDYFLCNGLCCMYFHCFFCKIFSNPVRIPAPMLHFRSCYGISSWPTNRSNGAGKKTYGTIAFLSNGCQLLLTLPLNRYYSRKI